MFSKGLVFVMGVLLVPFLQSPDGGLSSTITLSVEQEARGDRAGYIDPDALRQAARSGEPVDLDFGDVSFSITLWVHSMRAPGMRAGYIENGTFHEIDLPPVHTYRGRGEARIDDRNQTIPVTAALNIQDTGVDGTIKDQEGAWFIEPIKGEPRTTQGFPHILYRPGWG